MGEAGRAMPIVAFYGTRLLNQGNDIEPEALNAIISDYPSHRFVINRWEATILFNNVREPSEVEVILTAKLGNQARWPILGGNQKRRFIFLSQELPVEEVNQINKTGVESKYVSQNRHAERAGFGNDAEKTRKKLVADDGEN